MEKLRFTFAVLTTNNGKTNVICITSIETPHGLGFDLPDELKPVNNHIGITSLNFYIKIDYYYLKTRNLWIPLTPELRKIYLDESENVQFGEDVK